MKPQEEAEILLKRHEQEPDHTRHVARLALQLFEGLRPWHGRGETARALLEVAALLHDIGWSQAPTGEKHHKWSAKLIAEYAWKTLTPREVAITAQTARYHRKALPKECHEHYQKLLPKDQALVNELAGILRVADALDRSHLQMVSHVEVRLSAKTITLKLESNEECAAEKQMVPMKADLLELTSGRKVIVL
jgi:exopolyphosphatase/guanosine-5'-triphosphate,3'-diphosphate pyrophosphatase